MLLCGLPTSTALALATTGHKAIVDGVAALGGVATGREPCRSVLWRC